MESLRYHFPFKNCFCFRCRVRHFEFRWSADVGQCRQWHRQVWRSRKYGGRHWNVDGSSFNSGETMNLWFSRSFPNKSSCFWSRDRGSECHVITAKYPSYGENIWLQCHQTASPYLEPFCSYATLSELGGNLPPRFRDKG